MRREFRFCTITGAVKLAEGQTLITDSIAQSFECREAPRIEYSVAFGAKPYWDLARPGKGCFRADPQFRNPANLDFRLKPTSPCRKRASDGGDLGCRYTPEMLEIINVALELRRRKIIEF